MLLYHLYLLFVNIRMKSYTVAFIFNQDKTQWLCLHPKRPEWQVGFINGPGGKIEEGETPVQCMSREIEEECGLRIPEDQWQEVAVEKSTKSTVYFFAAVYFGELEDVQQKTDEALAWVSVDPLADTVIPNLRWLIPLALDRLERKEEIDRVEIFCA